MHPHTDCSYSVHTRNVMLILVSMTADKRATNCVSLLTLFLLLGHMARNRKS